MRAVETRTSTHRYYHQREGDAFFQKVYRVSARTRSAVDDRPKSNRKELDQLELFKQIVQLR